jgi:hypothetical protein
MKKRGGARPGAGAKRKYGEATANLTVRIPASKKQEVLELIRNYLADMRTNPVDIKQIDPHYGC